MKSMRTFQVCGLMVAAACVSAPTVFGQRMAGGGASRSYGASQMSAIFGKGQAFSATAEMSIIDKKGGDPIQMESSYAVLKGNLRWETDMTAMKGMKMPPEAIANMKQMGMDRTVSIYRGDKKLIYLVYPGLKSYCEMSPGQAQPSDKAVKDPKVDITQLGKETVDGHPCVKNKITMTTDDGQTHEMVTWNASDLKDFPIKTEMHADGATITYHFRDIKMSAPDASLFDPPSDYKKYGSMQEIMMTNMQRMMPPGAMSPHGGMPPRGGMPPQGGGDNE